MKYSILIMISFFLLTSCGSIKFDINGIPGNHPEAQIRHPNKTFWIGRSSDEVITHREFALMPFERREGGNGSKVWVFKNSGGFVSSSNCYVGQFGGSCSGSGGEVACNHVFFIADKTVTNYERSGACSEEQLKFRPLDKANNPILHAEERAQIERGIAAEGK